METKHTPAPWYKDGSFVLKITEKKCGGFDKELICETPHDSTYPIPAYEERRANASLIVVAPELFNVLEQLEDSVMACIEKFPETKALLLENQFNALEVIAKARIA